MYTHEATHAMAATGQKACIVVDHLVEALAGEPSAPLRRALILADIDQHPGTTQDGVMQRLYLNQTSMKREMEWLFNHGCIKIEDSTKDTKGQVIEICAYTGAGIKAALGHFGGKHEKLKFFLRQMGNFIGLEKPTLRDARIISTLFEKGEAKKEEVLDALYDDSPATNDQAYDKLVETGVINDG